MTAKAGTSTMHIGELADRTGLSLRTIRHYDDVGLLPATARTDGGFRVYSEDDFERLMVIKQMKPLGFSLEEMAEILTLLSAGTRAASSDTPKETEAGRAKLAEFLARNLRQADELIERLRRTS